MTGTTLQFLLLLGAFGVLIVAVSIHARRLRAQLTAAERRLEEMTRFLESSALESRRLSTADPLTGLANRRLFDETLVKEWARAARARQPLAVIMADIDHFKAHNDTYGHQAGDECLRRVAAVLKNSLHRPADLAARYGGEEFGVILPGSDFAGAAAVAERIRLAVQSLKLAHVENITGHDVTISLGVAVVVPDARASSSAIVGAADSALYTAKAVGRNQVIVADVAEQESETIPL